MKGMFIINPTSGQQKNQQTVKQVIHKLLDEGIAEGLYIMHTSGKNSAYDAVSVLKPGEYDFVVAVGGDGTVSEVINGIIDSESEIPVAIYAAGTTNDFASCLGLPRDVENFVEMVKSFRTEKVDVGKINDKYFLNVAAGGVLSEIAHKVSINAKTLLGHSAYILQGVKEIGSLSLKTVPLKYEMDNMTFVAETFLFFLANSKSVGGFHRIAPDAKINDGKLDLCIIKNVTPIDIVPVFTQIQTGTHTKDNKCITYLQTSKIVISTVNEDDVFPVDFDGEEGNPMPLTIEVVPGALNLLVPKDGRNLKKVI
ncbi:MAG: diacylglycerol kinase family lipid kinase [Clostridia bacterium]|nr:diacylglycerol kinase family lipid kinase [Clostridia bacterium]